MSERWSLPAISGIQNSGTEWLLNLIGCLPMECVNKVLMTLWRIWHVRNEVVHEKQPPPMEASCQFLMSYMQSLMQIKHHPGEDIIKGKFIVENASFHTYRVSTVAEPIPWMAPPLGWHKLNTDGSFSSDGLAGAGSILRDDKGKIIFSSCRQMFHTSDALEAELFALKEGLSLALHWSTLPLLLEVDCLEIVKLLKNEDMDRSIHMSLIEEIKSLMKIRQTSIAHVKRDQNISAHFMANYARVNRRTAVWLASGPDGLTDTCQNFVFYVSL